LRANNAKSIGYFCASLHFYAKYEDTMVTSAFFDNAATTPLDPKVLEAMMPYLTEHFGNPSSTHGFGNKVRAGIEKARRQVADLLNTSPSEVFFTSGGTEADNLAIRSGIHSHGLTHAVTSPLEHHAVLHTLEELAEKGDIELSLVRVNEYGDVDFQHLEELLSTKPRSFVSLMHGNNEIGTLTDIVAVGELCEKYDALFHTDTVQTMGHFPLDVEKIKCHYLTGAAHKFHGPKGVGFLYVNAEKAINPLQTGGAQERNMRGGTENVYGIVGLAEALRISVEEMEEHRQHVVGLKTYMIEKLQEAFPGIEFNGRSGEPENSLYTVLNVRFPQSDIGDMLLFNLDIHKIGASAGSACSSGSNIGSHVLQGINAPAGRPSVRFSFSKFNTKEEVDYVVEKLCEIFKVTA